MKVLLLEDNERLSKLIIEALSQKNYKVDWFIDGGKALNCIYDGYDCFILDINVPSFDGLSLLKEIKLMDKITPCIIISANIDLDTIKKAYKEGCNEYLKKPFYIYELETKLDFLCRKEIKQIKLENNFIYNLEKEILFKNDEEIKLSKKEILIFNLFFKNLDKIVTFEQIEHYVWEGNLTTNDNIRALVKRLRKKIPRNTIISQGGIGYKLNYKK